jgi:predicted MPP superfamily phosphohydrolase
MYLFISIFIATGLFFLFYKAYSNTKNVAVNTVTIDDKKAMKTSRSLSILHLSDFHLENLSISPDKLFKVTSSQPVDLIALTGDFLDRKRSIQKLLPYLDVFNQINPKYGIYAVFGNHDYVLNTKNFMRLKETLEENGCKTLQNENVVIDVEGTKLNIIGIDDYSTNRSNIKQSYEGIEEGYNLVLTHDPNVVLEMQDADFDYLLSGHFHGGQIHWPKPYHLVKMGQLVKMKMVKGLHYHDGKPFYISEGLGQTGVNIRIGSRPEITFHNIS